MTDEHNQRLQEQQEDAALELLMNEYAQIEGEALWRDYLAAKAAGKEPDAPQKEDRKLSRGSKNQNRHKIFLLQMGKCLKHAAVIFLVLLCLLSPLILSAEAFKIPVLNYIVALEKKFSGYNFGNNEHLTQTQEAVIQLIQSVPCPEGFSFAKQERTPNGKIWLDFVHSEKGSIRISLYPSDGQINIDTEDVDQISMQFHNYDAVYLKKEGYRLMWLDAERELVFDLRAFDMEEETFWKYAYRLVAKLS